MRPERDWPIRVQDILEAIEAIQAHVKNMDFDAFKNDLKTMDAVDFRFAVIGEAVTHIPDSVKQAHPEVPWGQARKMRNIVVHGYFGITADIVWVTIQRDLLPLAKQLERLLAEAK